MANYDLFKFAFTRSLTQKGADTQLYLVSEEMIASNLVPKSLGE